jgi:hypothetical protein
MAGSFDDKSSTSDQAGKRPAPTIEGTAKEVSVETEDKATDDASDETRTEKTESGETRALPSESDEDASETDEPESPAATRADQSDEGRRSFGASLLAALTSFTTHAAAGLLGGALVLVGMGLGYVPTPTSTDPDEAAVLKDRIATLEAAPQTPDNSAALKTLETRLAALESKAPDTPPELTSLAERVDQLDSSLKSMADAAKDGGSVADAAAISQQINAAEARLDARINETLAKTAGADGESIAALKKEVAGLEAKLKALTEAELGQGEASRLAPEVTELDERLDRLESTLPPLLEAVDKEAADTKAATLAMAFASLRAAVDAGRPYATELSTLAALSPGASDIGPLLEYEDEGIPTLRQLTVSFKETRDKVPAAPSADDDSFLNRLMSSAESLVKVKRVDGAAEGSTPDAVLARAEAKLEQGDLAAAAAEVGTLQGPPRAAFATWLDQARARLDAEETLQRLQKILLVTLGRNAPSVSGKMKEEPQEQN